MLLQMSSSHAALITVAQIAMRDQLHRCMTTDSDGMLTLSVTANASPVRFNVDIESAYIALLAHRHTDSGLLIAIMASDWRPSVTKSHRHSVVVSVMHRPRAWSRVSHATPRLPSHQEEHRLAAAATHTVQLQSQRLTRLPLRLARLSLCPPRDVTAAVTLPHLVTRSVVACGGGLGRTSACTHEIHRRFGHPAHVVCCHSAFWRAVGLQVQSFGIVMPTV